MTYSRDELATFTLQKLASIYPQNLEEETILKEAFEIKASNSSYFALTSLVDIKSGWQEEILQKYVDIRRETMPIENAATLNAEDESYLDASVITKEKELELQAKLDSKNAIFRGVKAKEEVEYAELTGGGIIDSEGNIKSLPVVAKVSRGRPKTK